MFYKTVFVNLQQILQPPFFYKGFFKTVFLQCLIYFLETQIQTKTLQIFIYIVGVIILFFSERLLKMITGT